MEHIAVGTESLRFFACKYVWEQWKTMSKRQSMRKFYRAVGTYNNARKEQNILLHDHNTFHFTFSSKIIHNSQRQKAPQILDSAAFGLI